MQTTPDIPEHLDEKDGVEVPIRHARYCYQQGWRHSAIALLHELRASGVTVLRCQKCKKHFIPNDDPTPCPHCGGKGGSSPF